MEWLLGSSVEAFLALAASNVPTSSCHHNFRDTSKMISAARLARSRDGWKQTAWFREETKITLAVCQSELCISWSYRSDHDVLDRKTALAAGQFPGRMLGTSRRKVSLSVPSIIAHKGTLSFFRWKSGTKEQRTTEGKQWQRIFNPATACSRVAFCSWSPAQATFQPRFSRPAQFSRDVSRRTCLGNCPLSSILSLASRQLPTISVGNGILRSSPLDVCTCPKSCLPLTILALRRETWNARAKRKMTSKSSLSASGCCRPRVRGWIHYDFLLSELFRGNSNTHAVLAVKGVRFWKQRMNVNKWRLSTRLPAVAWSIPNWNPESAGLYSSDPQGCTWSMVFYFHQVGDTSKRALHQWPPTVVTAIHVWGGNNIGQPQFEMWHLKTSSALTEESLMNPVNAGVQRHRPVRRMRRNTIHAWNCEIWIWEKRSHSCASK